MLPTMAVKELIEKRRECRGIGADDADAVLDRCPDERVDVSPCIVSIS